MKVHPHPEPDEPFYHRNSILWRRLLVFALGFSFLACLLALWTTGTVFGYPASFLPLPLMLFIQTNRLAILIIPLLSLLACYIALRYVTGDIMTCPDRYLDERQKMVRDRAHHHAYKIVNFVCLLIVLCLSLNAILFPAPAKGIPGKPVIAYSGVVRAFTTNFQKTIPPYQKAASGTIATNSPLIGWWVVETAQAQDPYSLTSTRLIKQAPGKMIIVKSTLPDVLAVSKSLPLMTDTIYEPVAWPNDPVSISIFYSVLLLSLFLLVKVLPMSVVAWKEPAS